MSQRKTLSKVPLTPQSQYLDVLSSEIEKNLYKICILQGRIQDFKLGRAHLKKLRRAEGVANIFGVFRVKNHDYTPKNHIYSNFRGGRGGAGCPPPWIRPCIIYIKTHILYRFFSIISLDKTSRYCAPIYNKWSFLRGCG